VGEPASVGAIDGDLPGPALPDVPPATPLSILNVKGLKGTLIVNGSTALLYLVLAYHFAGRPTLLPLLAFLNGILWWSFLEYHLHRFVLHWEPDSAYRKTLRKCFPAHRGHHNTPGDPDRIVNRRFALTVGLSLFQIGVMLALGFSPVWSLAVTGGTLIGHFFYEYLHVSCHVLKSDNRFMQLIKRHHLFHHYRDESVNFGVSSPVWDYVFRTVRRLRPDRPRPSGADAG
jgi:sterol desaturase/sphingolipid hydroxylase (fatty acid hydroxylase superfamily)